MSEHLVPAADWEEFERWRERKALAGVADTSKMRVLLPDKIGWERGSYYSVPITKDGTTGFDRNIDMIDADHLIGTICALVPVGRLETAIEERTYEQKVLRVTPW